MGFSTRKKILGRGGRIILGASLAVMVGKIMKL
jgi:hypothetical protein